MGKIRNILYGLTLATLVGAGITGCEEKPTQRELVIREFEKFLTRDKTEIADIVRITGDSSYFGLAEITGRVIDDSTYTLQYNNEPPSTCNYTVSVSEDSKKGDSLCHIDDSLYHIDYSSTGYVTIRVTPDGKTKILTH